MTCHCVASVSAVKFTLVSDDTGRISGASGGQGENLVFALPHKAACCQRRIVSKIRVWAD